MPFLLGLFFIPILLLCANESLRVDGVSTENRCWWNGSWQNGMKCTLWKNGKSDSNNPEYHCDADSVAKLNKPQKVRFTLPELKKLGVNSNGSGVEKEFDVQEAMIAGRAQYYIVVEGAERTQASATRGGQEEVYGLDAGVSHARLLWSSGASGVEKAGIFLTEVAHGRGQARKIHAYFNEKWRSQHRNKPSDGPYEVRGEVFHSQSPTGEGKDGFQFIFDPETHLVFSLVKRKFDQYITGPSSVVERHFVMPHADETGRLHKIYDVRQTDDSDETTMSKKFGFVWRMSDGKRAGIHTKYIQYNSSTSKEAKVKTKEKKGYQHPSMVGVFFDPSLVTNTSCLPPEYDEYEVHTEPPPSDGPRIESEPSLRSDHRANTEQCPYIIANNTPFTLGECNKRAEVYQRVLSKRLKLKPTTTDPLDPTEKIGMLVSYQVPIPHWSCGELIRKKDISVEAFSSETPPGFDMFHVEEVLSVTKQGYLVRVKPAGGNGGGQNQFAKKYTMKVISMDRLADNQTERENTLAVWDFLAQLRFFNRSAGGPSELPKLLFFINDLSHREWRLIFSPAVDSGLRSMANLMHHAVAGTSKRGVKNIAKEVGCFYGSRLLRAICQLHSGGYSAGWRDKELLPKLHLSNVWIRHGSGEPVFAPFTFVSPVAEEKLFEDAHKLLEMQASEPASLRGDHSWSLAYLLYELVHGKPPSKAIGIRIEDSSDFANIFNMLLGEGSSAETRATAFYHMEEMFQEAGCSEFAFKKPPFSPLFDKRGGVIGVEDAGGRQYVNEIVKTGSGPLPNERKQTGIDFQAPADARKWADIRCNDIKATVEEYDMDSGSWLELLDLPKEWRRSDMPEMKLENFIADTNPLGKGAYGTVRRVWFEEWAPLESEDHPEKRKQTRRIREFAKKEIFIEVLEGIARANVPEDDVDYEREHAWQLSLLLCNVVREVAIMGYTQSMSGTANLHYLFVDKVNVSVVLMMKYGIDVATKMLDDLVPNAMSHSMPPWEVALYADEMAAFLDELHQKVDGECIVHFDFKLDNIVIDSENGKLLLIDTGLAAFTSSSLKYYYAPYYTAPERQSPVEEYSLINGLVRELKSYGKRSGYLADVWALGYNIYLLAKATPPFPDLERCYGRRAESLELEKIEAYFHGKPDCTNLDVEMRKFILEALTQNPKERGKFFAQGQIRAKPFFKDYCPTVMPEFAKLKAQNRAPFTPLRSKLGSFQLLGYCNHVNEFYIKDHAHTSIKDYPLCVGDDEKEIVKLP